MKTTYLLSVLLFSAVVGCNAYSRLDLNAMKSKVEIGMTMAQVAAAIGEPTGVRGSAATVSSFSYLEGDEILIIRFERDRCISTGIHSTERDR